MYRCRVRWLASRFHESYASRMEFRIDQTQLLLLQERDAVQAPLNLEEAGIIKVTQVEPNVITLLFLTLEVPLARGLALGTLAIVCLIGYLFGLRMVLHPVRIDEVARIKSKYGALLIDVAGDNLQPGEREVVVATIDDLAKLKIRLADPPMSRGAAPIATLSMWIR